MSITFGASSFFIINLFFNKEQQHNEQIVGNSSWLARQKDYITDLKE